MGTSTWPPRGNAVTRKARLCWPAILMALSANLACRCCLRACLMLSVFARSRRVRARLRRANNGVCCVENARSAFSTQHTKSGERRRREQASVMESRQTLNKEEEYMPEAVIVSAVRTPIGRANKGVLKDVRADDLAAIAVKAAVERVPQLDRSLIEDVILGCAFPEGEQGMNLARLVG